MKLEDSGSGHASKTEDLIYELLTAAIVLLILVMSIIPCTGGIYLRFPKLRLQTFGDSTAALNNFNYTLYRLTAQAHPQRQPQQPVRQSYHFIFNLSW